MKHYRILAMGIVSASAALLHAAEITLPEDTARLADSPLPGYALATTYCYTCHSTDYIRYQPITLSRAAWVASVTKMQKTFRASIPDDAIEPIADYLVRTYGAERSGAALSTGEGATRANSARGEGPRPAAPSTPSAGTPKK
jgi:sulfite dehydrogenase